MSPRLIEEIRKEVGYTTEPPPSCERCSHSFKKATGVYESEQQTELYCGRLQSVLGSFVVEKKASCNKFKAISN